MAMSDDFVCTNCGHVGETKTVAEGDLALELLLWLCFLVPGIIYSIWRLTTRHEICPVCASTHLLPKSAPRAQKFLRDNIPEKLGIPVTPTYRPSKAAESAGKALGRLVGKVLK